MLAARELSADLPGKGNSWVNRHLQYTHGYGLAMCLAAEKDDQGGPVFTIEDLPPKGSPSVSRPEIYYGTEMTSYQIVPTAVKELDYPKGDQNVYTSYTGHGGVLLDSFWSLQPRTSLSRYCSAVSPAAHDRKLLLAEGCLGTGALARDHHELSLSARSSRRNSSRAANPPQMKTTAANPAKRKQ